MDASYTAMEKNCILIVDDDFFNRAVLQNIFAGQYAFEEAENGRMALEIIEAQADRFCAILLDMNMPEMDGIQLLRILNERGVTKTIPIFLITANDELEVARQAYELGVMDVINKPVVSFIIQRRVNSVIELFRARESLNATVEGQEKQLRENADTIDELHRSTIEALASAIEFRDMESGEHTNRIYAVTKCLLTKTAMGDGLTNDEIENISIGSIMHDLGKIAISDMILNKPGRLTPEEFEIMKEHTVKGSELMMLLSQRQAHPAYGYACDIARHHHERWDGKGYPDGLKGDEITVWSQVVSIADVYDALISPRVYKKAFTPDEAVKMIVGGECGQFNPKLIKCFLEVEPEIRQMYFPTEALPEIVRGRDYSRYFVPKAPAGSNRQEATDILLLVSAIMSSYDMIICANLTQNTFYMMSQERFLTHCTGNDGMFDDLIAAGATSIPAEARQQFIDTFSREHLLSCWEHGEKRVTLVHPQYTDRGQVHMVRTAVVMVEDSRTGDVIDLTFSRYMDEEWQAAEKHKRQVDDLCERIIDAEHDALPALVAELRQVIDETERK